MTLQALLTPHLEMLVHRVDGPMAFRFVLQPTVAMIFAIRAGLNDFRLGQSPRLLWGALVYRDGRARELFRLAWKDVNKVFFLACVLDLAYSEMIYGRLYPLQSLIVAFALAIMPYVLVRGRVTWIVRHVRGS
jgi:hypothetical protein